MIDTLAKQLGLSSDELKAELYRFRRDRVAALDADAGSSIPAEPTIRKWFSDGSTPSNEGIGFLLEYLFHHHGNLRTEFADWGANRLASSVKSTKVETLHTTFNQLKENARRKEYCRRISDNINEKFGSAFAVIRERSNGVIAVELLLLSLAESAAFYKHRRSLWQIGGHPFIGDMFFGYKAYSSKFVSYTTDIILNEASLTICPNSVFSNSVYLAKVVTSDRNNFDIYCKNAFVLRIPDEKGLTYTENMDIRDQINDIYIASNMLSSGFYLDEKIERVLREDPNRVTASAAEQALNAVNGTIFRSNVLELINGQARND